MKLYHDDKKLFTIIVLIILLIMPAVFSYAQTVSELQNKINQKDSDIAKLEEEIKAYQIELDNLGKQKSSLSKSLKELDLTRKKLNTDIAVTQKKIDKTNLKIQNLSYDINDKEKAIKNNLDSIGLEIKNTNEFEQSSMVENILSNDNFAFIWNDIDNMVTVRERIRTYTVELKQIKDQRKEQAFKAN